MYYYSMNELCEECIAFDRCGCCITQFSVVCRGYGGFGALGHYVYHRELLPRQVKGPWEGKIRHIATSGAHTAAITDSGRSDSLSMLNYSLGSSNTILCNQMAVMSCHSGLLLQLKLLIFDNCLHFVNRWTLHLGSWWRWWKAGAWEWGWSRWSWLPQCSFQGECIACCSCCCSLWWLLHNGTDFRRAIMELGRLGCD